MNFIDVIGTTGPQTLQLQDGEVTRHYAVYNGDPILKNGSWGKESSFSTADQALAFASEAGPVILKRRAKNG